MREGVRFIRELGIGSEGDLELDFSCSCCFPDGINGILTFFNLIVQNLSLLGSRRREILRRVPSGAWSRISFTSMNVPTHRISSAVADSI